jgi:methyl-accepting chemotaxis protein
VSGAQKALVATEEYVVRFGIAEGTSGLKAGAEVRLAGQAVGRVSKVGFFQPWGKGTAPEAVDIRVKVRKDIVLFEDAWAFLERPLLGNLSAINIASVGTGKDVRQPQGGDARLGPGEVLQGMVAPPAFLAQAGYGPEQVRQFQLMIAQASEAVERINRITTKVEDQIDPSLAGLRGAVEDIQSVTSDVRGRSDEWIQRLDTVLLETEKAAARLDPIATQVSNAVGNADAMVSEMREAIEANRPALDRIVASIDEAAGRVNRESVTLFNDTLATARQGAEEFGTAGRSFNLLLREQLPNIRRILANLRLAADQIKLTGVEVRRSPWRLLYQPKTKELESELFYDAARTYAEAVSDLRAASESLESAAASPAEMVDQEEAQRLNGALQESFERYRAAEQRLLDEMIKKR